MLAGQAAELVPANATRGARGTVQLLLSQLTVSGQLPLPIGKAAAPVPAGACMGNKVAEPMADIANPKRGHQKAVRSFCTLFAQHGSLPAVM